MQSKEFGFGKCGYPHMIGVTNLIIGELLANPIIGAGCVE
jgi:hypothetical protein